MGQPDSSSLAPQRTTPVFWGPGPIYSRVTIEGLPLLSSASLPILTPHPILPQCALKTYSLVSYYSQEFHFKMQMPPKGTY